MTTGDACAYTAAAAAGVAAAAIFAATAFPNTSITYAPTACSARRADVVSARKATPSTEPEDETETDDGLDKEFKKYDADTEYGQRVNARPQPNKTPGEVAAALKGLTHYELDCRGSKSKGNDSLDNKMRAATAGPKETGGLMFNIPDCYKEKSPVQ